MFQLDHSFVLVGPLAILLFFRDHSFVLVGLPLILMFYKDHRFVLEGPPEIGRPNNHACLLKGGHGPTKAKGHNMLDHPIT